MNSLFKDYENLLIKYDKLSKEIRNLKYFKALLEKQNKRLKAFEEKAKEQLLEQQKHKEPLI